MTSSSSYPLYFEFGSVENSKGELPVTVHPYSYNSETQIYTVQQTFACTYKNGELNVGTISYTLAYESSYDSYVLFAQFSRTSGSGLYTTFSDSTDSSIEFTGTGEYIFYSKGNKTSNGTYVNNDGVIQFSDGNLKGIFALYDGNTLHIMNNMLKKADSLPSNEPGITGDENGIVNISQYYPSNDDLKGKILEIGIPGHKTYFEFGNTEDSDGKLTGIVHDYDYDSNNNSYKQTGKEQCTYKNGVIISGHTENILVYDIKKEEYYSLAPFPRSTGDGLYSKFTTASQITLELNDSEKYIYTCEILNLYETGNFTFQNGVVFFTSGYLTNCFAFYTGEALYLLNVALKEADELPSTNQSISEASMDLSDVCPENDTLKGKKLLFAHTTSKNSYFEFGETENENGELPVTIHIYDSDSQSNPYTTGSATYKNGILQTESDAMLIAHDNVSNKYYAFAPFSKYSDNGLFSKFLRSTDPSFFISIELNNTGVYTYTKQPLEGPEATPSSGEYQNNNGFISFNKGILKDTFALYDGEKLYLMDFEMSEVSSLPAHD